MKYLLAIGGAIFVGFLGLLALTTIGMVGTVHADATTTITSSGAITTTLASGTLQDQINANEQFVASLNQQIATYQAELQQVGANKKTLQAAINSLDLQKNKVQAQINLTQSQINITQLQIEQIGGQIQDTQATIAQDQVSIGQYLRSIQKDDDKPLIVKVLSSDDLAEAWSDVNATLQVQGAIKGQMDTLQQQKVTLTSSQVASQQKQQTLTSQQQSLATQQKSLTATVQSKNQLLAQTNAQESSYEKLLASAEAQLNSFSAFTQNAGGSKLLINQTTCDSWGCYYNQRDAAWGNMPLDGTQYKLASDGCLVTAMAMVMTHYGYKDVTPVTINSDPDNFASYYPAYLLTTINVDNVSATRKTTTIDATLATGNPVIVGLYAYGGTHFVVLVSGSRGNYIMRDPYITNGKDISFSANYSLNKIFAVTKVSISS